MGDRKQDWEDVAFRLNYIERYKKYQLKIFEAYFLKGKEPLLHPLDIDPIPLAMRLWLSPDQSIEGWIAITARVLAGPAQWHTKTPLDGRDGEDTWESMKVGPALGGMQIARSLSDTYEIMMKFATANFLDGTTPFHGRTTVPPAGYMGGVERKLFDFLTGRTPGSEHFRYDGKPLFEPSGRLAGRYKELCIWLDGKQPHNPYNVIYYMGELWFQSLDERYMADLQSDEGTRFYLECYLAMVARYPIVGADPERAAYCAQLRTRLDQGPLLEPLDAMWEHAKQGVGPIDLNSYMREQPFYIGEWPSDVR
jgi:hypothetical protein